jgi:hypothetical protein
MKRDSLSNPRTSFAQIKTRLSTKRQDPQTYRYAVIGYLLTILTFLLRFNRLEWGSSLLQWFAIFTSALACAFLYQEITSAKSKVRKVFAAIAILLSALLLLTNTLYFFQPA